MNVTCHSDTGSSAAETGDTAAIGGAQARGDAAATCSCPSYKGIAAERKTAGG
jgi:hypothetical protein